MVISFPRSFPSELKLVAMSLSLEPTGMMSPTRGGMQIWADTGPKLWHGSLETTNLTPREFGVIQAWYETLLSEKEFYAYDKQRQYPIEHVNGWGDLAIGGVPFDGTGAIAVDSSGFTLNLKFLANGLTLTAGDMLAFDYGSAPISRALHRVVAGAVAAGGIMTVEVRPALRDGFATNDEVFFYRPAARMLVKPNSYDAVQSLDGTGRISFEAIQSI